MSGWITGAGRKDMISVDPGSNCPGFAVFCEKKLLHGGVEWNPKWGYYNDLLVIEKPTIYPRSDARPNDIVTLAISAGRLANTVAAKEERWVLPRQWKGQIPKTKKTEDYIIHKRIMKALADAEETTYLWVLATLKEADENNFVDAVGLGLHHLKRL